MSLRKEGEPPNILYPNFAAGEKSKKKPSANRPPSANYEPPIDGIYSFQAVLQLVFIQHSHLMELLGLNSGEITLLYNYPSRVMFFFQFERHVGKDVVFVMPNWQQALSELLTECGKERCTNMLPMIQQVMSIDQAIELIGCVTIALYQQAIANQA